MADDLDDFLKQAALRRQQRQQQQPQRPARTPLTSPPPLNQQPSPTQPVIRPMTPEVPLAKVVDEPSIRPTVGTLQPSIQSRHVEPAVSDADNRLNAHLKEVFQHELGSLKPAESKKTKGKQNATKKTEEAAAVVSVSRESASGVSSKQLVEQLRNPETLRLAIIAHEIMKRPWS